MTALRYVCIVKYRTARGARDKIIRPGRESNCRFVSTFAHWNQFGHSDCLDIVTPEVVSKQPNKPKEVRSWNQKEHNVSLRSSLAIARPLLANYLVTYSIHAQLLDLLPAYQGAHMLHTNPSSCYNTLETNGDHRPLSTHRPDHNAMVLFGFCRLSWWQRVLHTVVAPPKEGQAPPWISHHGGPLPTTNYYA